MRVSFVALQSSSYLLSLKMLSRFDLFHAHLGVSFLLLFQIEGNDNACAQVQKRGAAACLKWSCADAVQGLDAVDRLMGQVSVKGVRIDERECAFV